METLTEIESYQLFLIWMLIIHHKKYHEKVIEYLPVANIPMKDISHLNVSMLISRYSTKQVYTIQEWFTLVIPS